MQKHFIEVYDISVANKMMKRGFKVASSDSNVTVFINNKDSKFQFDACDKGKYSYTNRLNI